MIGSPSTPAWQERRVSVSRRTSRSAAPLLSSRRLSSFRRTYWMVDSQRERERARVLGEDWHLPNAANESHNNQPGIPVWKHRFNERLLAANIASSGDDERYIGSTFVAPFPLQYFRLVWKHLMGNPPPPIPPGSRGNNDDKSKKRRCSSFCSSKEAIQKIWEQLGAV